MGKVMLKGNVECLGALGEEIVPLNGNQRIGSHLQFTNTFVTEGELEVRGTINGQSLSELVGESLTNERTETITGYWNFPQGLTFKDAVTGSGELGGYNIQDLVDEKKAEALIAENNFAEERKYFYERCELLDILYRRVAQSPIKLEFFDSHQRPILLNQTVRIPYTLITLFFHLQSLFFSHLF